MNDHAFDSKPLKSSSLSLHGNLLPKGKLLCLLFICLVGVGTVVGCEKKEDAVIASSEKVSGAPTASSDDERARQFLTNLEAQPADQRTKYVSSHQKESTLAAQSHDPTISARFYSLMMPKMVTPQ